MIECIYIYIHTYIYIYRNVCVYIYIYRYVLIFTPAFVLWEALGSQASLIPWVHALFEQGSKLPPELPSSGNPSRLTPLFRPNTR